MPARQGGGGLHAVRLRKTSVGTRRPTAEAATTSASRSPRPPLCAVAVCAGGPPAEPATTSGQAWPLLCGLSRPPAPLHDLGDRCQLHSHLMVQLSTDLGNDIDNKQGDCGRGLGLGQGSLSRHAGRMGTGQPIWGPDRDHQSDSTVFYCMSACKEQGWPMTLRTHLSIYTACAPCLGCLGVRSDLPSVCRFSTCGTQWP